MAYFLYFDERALKESRKLGSTVREKLKKKLAEVLGSPRIIKRDNTEQHTRDLLETKSEILMFRVRLPIGRIRMSVCGSSRDYREE